MKSQVDTIYESIVYIERNLEESINISDMASYVGFSKYHFSRTFKDITGYNPYDYYRGRKVTKAIEFMLDHSCKIIEAAFEYNFTSPEVFTRACLSSLGLSPSQIKKLVVNDNFQGVQELTYETLCFNYTYKDIKTTRNLLPALLLKGLVFTTDDSRYPIDFTNTSIETYLSNLDTDKLYILHWPSKEKTGYYHHLLATSVSLELTTDTDDFSSDIYKLVPANEYIRFPIIQENKELIGMRDYIYNNYLPTGSITCPINYEVETMLLGQKKKRVKESFLHIPVKRELNKN